MTRRIFWIIIFLVLIGITISLSRWHFFSQKETIYISPTPFTIRIPSSIPIVSPSPTPQLSGQDDYTSWKIVQVCIPVASVSGDPLPIIDLHDGTFIYKSKDGTLFRGTANQCRCLASNTIISASSGGVNVTQLKVGMQVWTMNKNGQKELQPIIKLSSIYVGNNYRISHL